MIVDGGGIVHGARGGRWHDGGMVSSRPVPTSASYSITVRLLADPDPAVVGRIATAVGAAGGVVTAVDVAESRHDRITVDVTCSAVNGEHAEEVVGALGAVDGVTVHKVSDR